MKHIEPILPLVIWLSAAAVGCAGTLDENADYYASAKPARVVGSGGRSADAKAWSDAGAAGAAGESSSWRDAGSPLSESNEGSETQAEDAGPAVSASAAGGSAAGWSAGGAGGANGTAAGSAGASGKAATAAAGSGGAAAAGACDFRGLVMQKCAGASCHGGPTASTGLDLTSAMLAQRAQGKHGSGSCTDKLLVDTEQPAQSKLYLKISGTSCGVKMPLGGSLTASEEACVLSWIEGL